MKSFQKKLEQLPKHRQEKILCEATKMIDALNRFSSLEQLSSQNLAESFAGDIVASSSMISDYIDNPGFTYKRLAHGIMSIMDEVRAMREEAHAYRDLLKERTAERDVSIALLKEAAMYVPYRDAEAVGYDLHERITKYFKDNGIKYKGRDSKGHLLIDEQPESHFNNLSVREIRLLLHGLEVARCQFQEGLAKQGDKRMWWETATPEIVSAYHALHKKLKSEGTLLQCPKCGVTYALDEAEHECKDKA